MVNVSPASAQQYGVDPVLGQGVLVTQTGGGFAQKIGLQPGDFIREVNGRRIATTADLAAALQPPAHGWTLVIQRGGRTITARFGVLVSSINGCFCLISKTFELPVVVGL